LAAKPDIRIESAKSFRRIIDKTPKNLMHMLCADGNPRTDNRLAIIGCLQAKEGRAFKRHGEVAVVGVTYVAQ
jgi:hypothetical protein